VKKQIRSPKIRGGSPNPLMRIPTEGVPGDICVAPTSHDSSNLCDSVAVKNPKLRELRVQWVSVDKLIPYAGNSRTHSAAQVAQVAGSIRQFGWTNPLLIRPDGVIIAGHGRLLAARKLGMPEVPVIELAGLSEAQCRALVIADNQLALNAGWDEQMLSAELAALREDNFPLELLGIQDEKLIRLLAEATAADRKTDPDAVPPRLPTTATVTGDLWRLGEHRLLCGDPSQGDTIERVLAGRQADMVFADPANPCKGLKKLVIGTDHDHAREENFHEFLEQSCARILAVCTGAIYVCTPASEMNNLYSTFTAAGGYWSAFIICVKDELTRSRSDYQRQYDAILYGWRQGNSPYWCGARDQGDVWIIPQPTTNQGHRIKPVELVERAVRNSSRPGDTILDPFAGSGTTLIACERQHRRACLLEVDPLQADRVCQRWQQYSSQPAIRDRDGRSFAEVAETGAAR
jgi:DNA modification methylase